MTVDQDMKKSFIRCRGETSSVVSQTEVYGGKQISAFQSLQFILILNPISAVFDAFFANSSTAGGVEPAGNNIDVDMHTFMRGVALLDHPTISLVCIRSVPHERIPS